MPAHPRNAHTDTHPEHTQSVAHLYTQVQHPGADHEHRRVARISTGVYQQANCRHMVTPTLMTQLSTFGTSQTCSEDTSALHIYHRHTFTHKQTHMHCSHAWVHQASSLPLCGVYLQTKLSMYKDIFPALPLLDVSARPSDMMGTHQPLQCWEEEDPVLSPLAHMISHVHPKCPPGDAACGWQPDPEPSFL